MQFSETLKARLVAYISNRYKVHLSEPQSEEFSHALAGVYEWAERDGGGSGDRKVVVYISCERRKSWHEEPAGIVFLNSLAGIITGLILYLLIQSG